MRFPKSFASRLNFYVLSLTTILFLCLGLVLYLHTSKKETENAHKVTKSLVENISLNLDLELKEIQDVIKNTAIQVFENRNNPDKMMEIIEEMVSQTDTIYGGGVAFEPDYFSSKGRLFMEYAYWENDTSLIIRHFRGKDLDYLDKAWYTDARKAKNGLWSKPYVSELEQHTVMISYSTPVIDEKGDVFAVVIADLALIGLTEDLEKMSPYEDNYSFIIDQSGRFISHPNDSLVLNATILSDKDPQMQSLGRKVLSEGNGIETVRINGKKHLVSYSEIQTLDYVVCCITPYSSILKDLGRVTIFVLVILFIGLLCLLIGIRQIVNRESAPVDIMEQDLAIARKIQEKMLPDIKEAAGIADKVDIYAFLRPARDVGGDLYDFFVSDGKLYFAVGDVSGKGVPAALIMSFTKSSFRICSKGKDKAEDIIKAMNASLMENDLSNMFITLFAGVIDLESNRLSFCNAGHEQPVLSAQGKSPILLGTVKNFPIGVMKEAEYNGESIQLTPSDRIFIFTDGVTEAEDAKGRYLGENAVIEILRQDSDATAKKTTDNLLTSIDLHTGGKGQSDDITILCIKLIRQ